MRMLTVSISFLTDDMLYGTRCRSGNHQLLPALVTSRLNLCCRLSEGSVDCEGIVGIKVFPNYVNRKEPEEMNLSSVSKKSVYVEGLLFTFVIFFCENLFELQNSMLRDICRHNTIYVGYVRFVCILFVNRYDLEYNGKNISKIHLY